MPSRRTPWIPTLLACILAATAVAQEPVPPHEMPPVVAPPLELAAPPAPSHEYRGRDLRQSSGAELRGGATSLAYRSSRPDLASQVQHFAILADATQGRLDLARYYSMDGKVDAAAYWLQEAIIREGGVDPAALLADDRFKSLKSDPRWDALVDYAERTREWFAQSGSSGGGWFTVPLRAPSPTPILIVLHGAESSHRRFPFASHEEMEQLADALGVAIFVHDATVRTGRTLYRWSGDLERDLAHIDEQLETMRGTVELGPRYLLGFSQGAQLAALLLGHYPDRFHGAIVASPAWGEGIELEARDEPSPPRMCIITQGEEESPGSHELGRATAGWLQASGVTVLGHLYANHGHAPLPTFADNLQLWLPFLRRFSQEDE